MPQRRKDYTRMETELKKQIKRTIQKLWCIYCLFSAGQPVALSFELITGCMLRVQQNGRLKIGKNFFMLY